jgi:hypothetical protein
MTLPVFCLFCNRPPAKIYRRLSGEPVECCAVDACHARLDELHESERHDFIAAGLITDRGASD